MSAVLWDMKHYLSIIRPASVAVAVAVALLLGACAATKGRRPRQQQTVAYDRADHYFFNNDAEVPRNPMVTSRQDFERLYGMAAVMGRGGQPTPIDFTRQFVIGIVLPLTNRHTEIVPGPLVQRGDTLTLHYRVKVAGREMSSTMRPMELIIVDRSHRAKVCVLQEE